MITLPKISSLIRNHFGNGYLTILLNVHLSKLFKVSLQTFCYIFYVFYISIRYILVKCLSTPKHLLISELCSFHLVMSLLKLIALNNYDINVIFVCFSILKFWLNALVSLNIDLFSDCWCISIEIFELLNSLRCRTYMTYTYFGNQLK